MGDGLEGVPIRGKSSVTFWDAECKDCVAERRLKRRKRSERGSSETSGFQYSGAWAAREQETGHTRSDRCPRHRRAHKQAIRALAVPYVDLNVIGRVRDANCPTGPLGGLGPLPKQHEKGQSSTDLQKFGFGMSDADILEILKGMKKKRVAVIEAGTGSGKSTFMPFRFMFPPDGASFRPTENGPIVVTEPRRAAATGVATFVGENLCFDHDSSTCNRHIGPGFPVGYQVSGDQNWDGACDLVYVTDGTMINWVRDGSLARFGMVIVDEAHERNENIDIILAQLREKLHQYKHLRVVITSATIDKDFFISYFGGEEKVFHHVVPEKKSFGYGVPFFSGLEVTSSRIENGFKLEADGKSIDFSGWSAFGPEDPAYPPDDLRAETVKYAKLHCIDEIPVEEWSEKMPSAVARQVLSIAEGTEWGDILGFLPTKTKIYQAIEEIQSGLAQRGLDFDVFPLLSSVDKKIIEKAIAARRRGEKRKIVISSNLAETSLTVSGVRFVVDSGLICQSTWNMELVTGNMVTIPHSQSGLRQRWGRVGRDSPGWVFPLYTTEQFLLLAHDTPPESTRKNLESFCSKLIAAGVDIENADLPASFEDSGFEQDSFGREASETFKAELSRAHGTLKQTGLIDEHGDLTELGREIERYPGDASEALAIILGDRLSCLHEVAFGVTTLGNGMLYGLQANCILRTNFDWSPEWRLRAAACHRALAHGCKDDLDLAVRIASLYQTAADGEQWCRTWWVNQTALDEALTSVADTVASLSAAMKGEAWRPISPTLAPKARAILSRAFSSLRFQRINPEQFCAVGDEASVPVSFPERRYGECGDVVMAFKRYRDDRKGSDGGHYISHVVNVDEWATLADSSSIDSGFDLLLEVGRRRLSGSDVEFACLDPLAQARSLLPIGSVFEFCIAHGPNPLSEIKEAVLLKEPFLGASIATGIASGVSGEADSGFDPEWDPRKREDAVPDEEEEAAKPLDPRKLEVNDSLSADAKCEVVLEKDSAESLCEEEPIFARMLFEECSPDSGTPYLISGYEIENGSIVALLETFDTENQSLNPARHMNLDVFDDIELEYLGAAEDSYWSFLQFRRCENHERFVVPEKEFYSLQRYVESSVLELVKGVTLNAVVIAPKKQQRSVSAKLWLQECLRKSGTPSRMRDGKEGRLYPASVFSEVDEHENVEVEFDDVFEPGGIRLRTRVKSWWLGEEKGIPIAIGQALRIAFEDWPDRKPYLSPVSEELERFVKRSGGRLKNSNNRVVALRPVDLPLARMLLKLDKSEEWTEAVSALFEGSQYVRAAVALPPIRKASVQSSDICHSLISNLRIEFEQRFEVRAKVGASGAIELQTQNDEALKQATSALEKLGQSAYVKARIPSGTAGLVIGPKHRDRLALQARKGIDWVWIDNDILYVVGDSLTNVKAVMVLVREKVSKVSAVVSLPSGRIGLFIGPNKGENIREAIQLSGCRANQIGKSPDYRVTGPTVASIEMFATLQRRHVNDLTVQIHSVSELETLIERKRSVSGTTAKMKRALSGNSQRKVKAAKRNPQEPKPKAKLDTASSQKVMQSNLGSEPNEPTNEDADTTLNTLVQGIRWLLRKR